MDREQVRKLLKAVHSGRLSVEQALLELRLAQLDQLEFATLDMQRAVRRGFPEVVYGPGKSAEQIVGIVRRLRRAEQTVLVTRVGPEVHDAIKQIEPAAEYHALARAVTARPRRRLRTRPGITVVTAGTADIGVAEEAVLTAELMGHSSEKVYDVGVAGLHRLLSRRATLLRARVIVVVAGMEGALPSVVAGLTDCPVIGVPSSAGYGVGRPGEAALLAMLHSCAGGLTVVNVDNGFGAGFAAALINGNDRRPVRRRARPRTAPRGRPGGRNGARPYKRKLL